jgi:hypothetical protein
LLVSKLPYAIFTLYLLFFTFQRLEEIRFIYKVWLEERELWNFPLLRKSMRQQMHSFVVSQFGFFCMSQSLSTTFKRHGRKYLSLLALAGMLVTIFSGSISSVKAEESTELLKRPWNLSGRDGASERYQPIRSNSLNNKTALEVTYNLHGTCLLGGDASALIFDQPYGGEWHYVSLSNYGENCKNGEQTVTIPLADFPGLKTNERVGTFHVRIWNRGEFKVDITSAKLLGSKAVSEDPPPSPTPDPTPVPTTEPTPQPTTEPLPTPTPTPAPVPLTGKSWEIQSVSSMKETKDRICNMPDHGYIERWVDKAKELGVTHVAVETPYDNPACGDAVSYTKTWVDVIRSRGLKVWHRHMFLAFEGIYDTPKNNSTDYLAKTRDYIKAHRDFFAEGDIFTPAPEPQNGGIGNMTYCAQGVCQFRDIKHFNQWLRDAIDVSNQAFSEIGLGGKVKTGYYGFDGFIAWGSNNPDWNGILEDTTVQKMGNITIDHYPELIGQTMKQGLDELQSRYPGVPIIIGEWGSAGSGDVERQVIDSMGACNRPGVVGFNYWHMGMGGNEALINNDFSSRPQFDEVQSFFKGQR